jgi:hypothetical protein
LEESKLKIFRWKLIQYIIPTKKLLFQWKIVYNNRCNFCGNEEDYFINLLHVFFLKRFGKKYIISIYFLFHSIQQTIIHTMIFYVINSFI